MAGLTKELRAKREAEKAQTASAAGLPASPPETVRMKRSEPMHVRGPVTADVHPDEVENWKAAGWKEV